MIDDILIGLAAFTLVFGRDAVGKLGCAAVVIGLMLAVFAVGLVWFLIKLIALAVWHLFLSVWPFIIIFSITVGIRTWIKKLVGTSQQSKTD
jgi:hypothetical protein